MESWKDAMKRLGVDLDAIRYKQREEDQGCVIRAFSSAVGVRAEESDYRERLIQLDRQDDTQFEYEYTSARRMGQSKSSDLCVTSVASNNFIVIGRIIRATGFSLRLIMTTKVNFEYHKAIS